LCIICVYLKYNSSNTESNLKYQHQLRILEECICKAKEMNTEFIIIGDFNGDIQRLRYLNDINLLNFINKTALESVKNQSLNIEYTYHKGENKSVIDYLFVSKVNISKYKNSVVENKYNTSDHCALLLELSFDNKENAAVSVEIEDKTVNNINWNNMNIVQKYSNKANEELRKVRFNNAWSNDDNIQESVDELYNKITYARKKANQETIDKFYSKKFKR
jgi:hypothetical protein